MGADNKLVKEDSLPFPGGRLERSERPRRKNARETGAIEFPQEQLSQRSAF
jgi:hypothetical protein